MLYCAAPFFPRASRQRVSTRRDQTIESKLRCQAVMAIPVTNPASQGSLQGGRGPTPNAKLRDLHCGSSSSSLSTRQGSAQRSVEGPALRRGISSRMVFHGIQSGVSRSPNSPNCQSMHSEAQAWLGHSLPHLLSDRFWRRVRRSIVFVLDSGEGCTHSPSVRDSPLRNSVERGVCAS